MTLTRIGGGVDSTPSVATRTFTVGTTPTPGKRLVLVVVHTNSGSTTIKDARSNTWQLAAEQVSTASPIMNVQMYTCHPTTPLAAGDVITVTHSQTTSYLICDLYEPSEFLGADDDGQGAFNNAGTTTPTIAVTPTVTPTVTIAAVGWGGASTALSQPSGWQQGDFVFQVGTGTSLRNLAVAESSTGATSYAATLPAAAPWVVVAADFPTTVASNPVDSGASTPTTGGGSLTFAWTGVPYADGQWISTKTSGATGVRIKYATDAAVTTSPLFSSAVTPDADGYAKHHLSGLTPGTKYYYKVEVGGALASPVGSFRTNSDYGTFTFAFGSCLGNSSNTAFTNAMSYNPELFLHLGDFAYADNTSTSVDTHRGYIEGKIASTSALRDILRNVPSGYLLSDHDSGTNDFRGGPAAWTPAINESYRQVVPNKPVTTTGQYWSFVYKGVRFIMTDAQSYSSKASVADTSSKTMFGSAQKAWIKAELKKPEKLKVLAMEGPWVWQSLDATSPKWNGYNTERAEIGKFITDNGVDCFIIHGDQHSLSADDGSHAAGGMPVFGAAPFGGKTTSFKGGPYSEGNYPTSETGQPNQVGIVTVTNTSAGATSITVAFKGITTDNTAHVAYTKTFTVPAGSPSAPVDPEPGAPGSGGSTGGTTPPPDTTPTPPDPPVTVVGDGTSVVYDGTSMVPAGTGGGTTASSFTALGAATVGQYTQAYASAPTLQISGVSSTSATAAVANGTGATFSIQRAGSWRPQALSFKVAVGGTSTPRGIVVRTSADNFTANLSATTDVTTLRPSWDNRSIDLTGLGTITGTLTFRLYMYAPTTSASLEIDDLTVRLAFDSTSVPAGSLLASDPWTVAGNGPWTTQDNGGGATFDVGRTDGTATITLPASPTHDLTASTRSPAMVLQPASGDFDVAIHVQTPVNAAATYRGVGLIATGATTDRELHVMSYDKAGITQRFDFAFADSASTATSFGLLDFVSGSYDLRFKRAGSTWSYYTSTNGGATWTLQDTATATFQQTQVGFFAVGSEAFTATFGAFRNLLASGSALSSGWSLYNGSGLAETPLRLEGYWTGTSIVPLTMDTIVRAGDVAPPVITVGSPTAITADGATIQFTTNEPATMSIDFGPSESNMSGRLWWTQYLTSFPAVFTQLTANTVYYCRATATDANGNSAVTPVFTFTTAGGTTDPGGVTDQPASGPQIVGTIAKTVTSTSAAISFTTDVPAARKLMYRVSSGGDWITNTRTAAPGTTHTINLGSLASATAYTCDLYLATDTTGLDSASPVVFTFTTSAAATTGGGSTGGDTGGSTGGDTGGSTGGGTSSGTKLSYRPPTLSSPTTVYVTNSNTNLTLDKSKDYIVKFPTTPITSKVTITGGHNVVIVGGEIQAPDADCLYPHQWTGHMHIEGMALGALDGSSHDLIRCAADQSATNKNFTVTNMLMRENSGSRTDGSGGQGIHADVIQFWTGAAGQVVTYDRILGLDCNYQGFMWQPAQFGVEVAKWVLRDVVLRKKGTSGYLIYYGRTVVNGVPVAETPRDWQRVTLVTTDIPGTAIYPKTSFLHGTVAQETGLHYTSTMPASPLLGSPGKDYVSPGYL